MYTQLSSSVSNEQLYSERERERKDQFLLFSSRDDNPRATFKDFEIISKQMKRNNECISSWLTMTICTDQVGQKSLTIHVFFRVILWKNPFLFEIELS